MHDRFNSHVKSQKTSPKKINAENEIAVGDFAVVYPNNGDVLVNHHKYAEDASGREYIIMTIAENKELAEQIVSQNREIHMNQIFLAKIIGVISQKRRKVGNSYKIEVENN